MPGQRIHHDDLMCSPELRTSLYASYRIDGELDVNGFIVALSQAVKSHEVLRIGVSQEPGRDPRQWLREEPGGGSLISCRNVQSASEEQFNRYARAVLAKDLSDSWDLGSQYPFRYRLLRYSPTVHAFLATFSHVALDGRGRSLVLQSLWQNLAGGERHTSPVSESSAAGFMDSALRHAEISLAGGARTSEFWLSRLRQKLPPVRFSADLLTEPASRECATERVLVQGERLERIRSLSRLKGCSEFQWVVAAFADTVFEVVPQDRVAIMIPVDTRLASEQNVSGMFTVPLPLFIERTESLDQSIRQARREILSVIARRNVSSTILDGIREALSSADSADAPGFSVTYVNGQWNQSEWHCGDVVAQEGAYRPRVSLHSTGMDLRAVSGDDSLELTLTLDVKISSPDAVCRVIAFLESRIDGSIPGR
ncbi:condensation domain-containing protein [Kitasatospora sp. NPDC056138]|uniref:condensation domain-containing protein n=1 Tax=Kitasatospora sp. NPDC056138 TaxID=3345724 RepID=UPI0035E374B0